MNINAIKESKNDRIFLLLLYASLSILFAVFAFPLLYILSASFSSSEAVIGGKVWLWPVKPTLNGYIAVFVYPGIWRGYLNSGIYTVLATILSVSLTIMFAYPLSRKTFYGRKLFVMLLLFAMLFSGGLIPYYLVVKELGMVNTIWAMIVPSSLNVFSVLVAKTFFQSNISDELYEASQIDGCSDSRFLMRIIIPLSKPIIAVLVLWSAVSSWNTYFSALIFLSDTDLYPLQLILREILVLNNVQMNAMNLTPELIARFQEMKNLMKYSLIIVTSIPVLVLYPFVQKYFVQGVMIGSVKE